MSLPADPPTGADEDIDMEHAFAGPFCAYCYALSHARCVCHVSRSQPPLPLSNRSILENQAMTFERWMKEHRREAKQQD